MYYISCNGVVINLLHICLCISTFQCISAPIYIVHIQYNRNADYHIFVLLLLVSNKGRHTKFHIPIYAIFSRSCENLIFCLTSRLFIANDAKKLMTMKGKKRIISFHFFFSKMATLHDFRILRPKTTYSHCIRFTYSKISTVPSHNEKKMATFESGITTKQNVKSR